jgi:DnaJ-class molecular chaperone
MQKISFTVICNNGDGRRELMLPGTSKNVICSRCDGEGVHCNPAIDGHGISPEEFDEDPDFRENYFSGVYDVRCEECHGEKIIKQQRLALEFIPAPLRKRIHDTLAATADEASERAHYKRLAAAGIEY